MVELGRLVVARCTGTAGETRPVLTAARMLRTQTRQDVPFAVGCHQRFRVYIFASFIPPAYKTALEYCFFPFQVGSIQEMLHPGLAFHSGTDCDTFE